LLIDCKPICHAAINTTGTLSYKGKPTGVIYGFLKKIFDIAYKFQSNRIIFLWDAGRSYRTDFYSLYKHSRDTQRKEFDQDEWIQHERFTSQLVNIHQNILPEIGFKNIFCFPGFEADDIIAQVTNEYCETNKIIVVTNDNDMFQLLDRANMYRPMGDDLFTRRLFRMKYGIKPEQWVEAKSIGGCSGDDVPGIAGIGDPKSASSMALKYLRGELTKGKVFDKIVSDEGQDTIKMCKKLVELPYLGEEMPPIKLQQDEVTKKKLTKILDRFMFVSLLEQKFYHKIQSVFNF
jgi:protein Xni